VTTASTAATPPSAARPARPQGGPPLLAPALAYGALMVTAVVLSARMPQPSATAIATAAYDSSHHAVLEVAGCLGFAASAPLAIWTATTYRRLLTLGVTAPGAVIALAGGLLAAASLGLSGLITWTSSQAAAADPAAARILADLSFATGAAGFVVPLALLLAGVAVPSLILRLVPRPLAWAGLVIAAIGVLSTFALLTPALDGTLPVGRFGGLLWLIAASIALPRTRRAARTHAPDPSPAPASQPAGTS
jgi:hypothetical protein